MEDIAQQINNIPIITRYALISYLIIAFDLTYLSAFGIKYIYLDFNYAFKKFQLWRLFTNFLIGGSFSFPFLMFLFMFYNTLSRLEKSYAKLRRYAELIMLLLYLMLICNLVFFIGYMLLNQRPPISLINTLLIALMYIDSKKNPEAFVTIYFFSFKSKL